MSINTFPSNEAETVELFRLGQTRLGWHFAHLQIAFPDAVIENEQGQQLVAEFEYRAKNFHKHGHPVDGADLIICWHDNWPDAPLPVWALEGCLQEEAEIVCKLVAPKREERLQSQVAHIQTQCETEALVLKEEHHRAFCDQAREYGNRQQVREDCLAYWRWYALELGRLVNAQGRYIKCIEEKDREEKSRRESEQDGFPLIFAFLLFYGVAISLADVYGWAWLNTLAWISLGILVFITFIISILAGWAQIQQGGAG